MQHKNVPSKYQNFRTSSTMSQPLQFPLALPHKTGSQFPGAGATPVRSRQPS